MFDIDVDFSMDPPTHTSVCYANTNAKVDDVDRASTEGYEICNRGNVVTQVTSISNQKQNFLYPFQLRILKTSLTR